MLLAFSRTFLRVLILKAVIKVLIQNMSVKVPRPSHDADDDDHEKLNPARCEFKLY
jgi:hypothetical protein